MKKISSVLGIFWLGMLLLFQPAFGAVAPQGLKNPPGGIVGYVPGTIVINFRSQVNLPEPKSNQAQSAGVAKTGIASVDALNVKYNVRGITKLLPREKPPAPGSPYGDLSRYYVLDFPSTVDLDQIVTDFANDPNIESAVKDAIVMVDISPNDVRYVNNEQWSLNSNSFPTYDMDMPEAWAYERGDSTVILAIIDTGVLRTHLDLGGTAGSGYTSGNMWINWAEKNGTGGFDDDANGYIDDSVGYDFVSVSGASLWPGEEGTTPDNNPTDFNGHGTHVSGIAAAMTNNSSGVAGTAGGWYTGERGCKIMALRVGYSGPDPMNPAVERGFIQSAKVAEAINYARIKGATAMNMSFGFGTAPANITAVKNALLDGIIMVHSAGNDGADNPSVIDTNVVLGTTNQVISAASTGEGGFASSFTNYGTWIEVSAPGELVTNTYSAHGVPTYAILSGTSMSSPHIVGLAGLMKSAFPDADGEQIFDWILNTTTDIDALNPTYAGQLGTGLINANNFFSTVPIANFGVSSVAAASASGKVKPLAASPASTGTYRGHVPYQVTFADSSTGPVDSLFWQFGDGGTSTATNPTHTYMTAGAFTVRQSAWSDSFGTLYGVASKERKDNYIFVIADSVYFGPGHAAPGEKKIPVRIYYYNNYPVTDLNIPIRFAGIDSLVCDSVGFVGSRISGFIFKSATIDNVDQTIMINASDFSPLAPGNGLLGIAYFSMDSSVVVGDTAGLDSAIVGGQGLEVVSTDPVGGTYDPKLVNGFLAAEAWHRGDVNKSGKMDLADVIGLINHLFKGAAAPNPAWLGDFNADGVANLADVISMVNRLFKGI